MVIYLCFAALGILVLALMVVAGDLTHDIDHDVGSHDAFGHGEGPSVFSVKVVAAFLSGFGAAGAVARYLELGHAPAAIIGTCAGVLVGGSVYGVARLLHAQQASSDLPIAGLLGRPATVIVSIPRNGGVGQVVVDDGGAFLALADSEIDVGRRVRVLGAVGSTLRVG